MAEDKAVRKARERLDKALEANKNDDAIKQLKELRTLEPKNARWPHKQGDLNRKLGRNRDAVECYALAVDIYADQGFIARAVAMAKTVLNLDPSRIDILEQVDPQAAALLKAHPPGAAQRSPVSVEEAASQRLSQLVNEPVSAAPSRHAVLSDEPAAVSSSAPRRHPMVLDEPEPARHARALDEPVPVSSAPRRQPNVLNEAEPARHARVQDEPVSAPPQRHAVPVLRGERRDPTIRLDDETAAPASGRAPMYTLDPPPLPPSPRRVSLSNPPAARPPLPGSSQRLGLSNPPPLSGSMTRVEVTNLSSPPGGRPPLPSQRLGLSNPPGERPPLASRVELTNLSSSSDERPPLSRVDLTNLSNPPAPRSPLPGSTARVDLTSLSSPPGERPPQPLPRTGSRANAPEPRPNRSDPQHAKDDGGLFGSPRLDLPNAPSAGRPPLTAALPNVGDAEQSPLTGTSPRLDLAGRPPLTASLPRGAGASAASPESSPLTASLPRGAGASAASPESSPLTASLPRGAGASAASPESSPLTGTSPRVELPNAARLGASKPPLTDISQRAALSSMATVDEERLGPVPRVERANAPATPPTSPRLGAASQGATPPTSPRLGAASPVATPPTSPRLGAANQGATPPTSPRLGAANAPATPPTSSRLGAANPVATPPTSPRLGVASPVTPPTSPRLGAANQAATPPTSPRLGTASPVATPPTSPRLGVPNLLATPPTSPRIGLPNSLAAPPAARPRIAPPAPPPSAAGARGLPPRPPALTLDKLSLPPGRPQRTAAAATAALQPPAPSMAIDIYASALDDVSELSRDPDSPANETRFSDSPPRMRSDIDLSDIELEPRQPVSEIEALQPAPTAATLAKLPLFPLFAEMPKTALAAMIASSELIELPHGAYVVRKGDPGDALYGLLEGSVEIIAPGHATKLTLAEGDVFGESSLLQDEASHADVMVQGKLVALRVPREVLLEGVENHPPLAELLLELLTRRLLANLVHASPLFQEFDAAGRQELARLFEIRRAAAETQLAAAGKKMDGLYISLTGTLSVREPGAPEQVAPPGSMFGQNTLLTQAPSTIDVRARVNMIVLRLPTAHFSRLAMQYPTVIARLADMATAEIVQVTV